MQKLLSQKVGFGWGQRVESVKKDKLFNRAQIGLLGYGTVKGQSLGIWEDNS